MKRFVSTLCLLALALCATTVHAENGSIYVAPKFGLGTLNYDDIKLAGYKLSNSESDDVASFGIAAGYDFHKMGVDLRAELEYAINSQYKYTGSGASGGDSWNGKVTSDVQTFFANLYYDFFRESPFNVYLGAGLGVAAIDSKLSGRATVSGTTYSAGYSTDVTNFAWNAGAGVVYRFDEHWAADLGYRYENIGQAEIKVGNEKLKGDGYFNKAILGLRYTF